MTATIRPLASARARNPELAALASEIRVMVLAVMRARGWSLTRIGAELGISKTQLHAARFGECDPRATFLRDLQKLYAALPQKRTGT
jgi:N-acyl-L-homoserine lactone synthetase